MLSGLKMPFCPGCSHGPSVKFLAAALEEGGYEPLDVVIVSDIGCCGLVDPLFNTHTIHGLHGRSPALAMGVALGLNNPDKKVIAVQGDGGATIGLQHLLEAARRNLDITLVLLNNLIYGMTGGQVSGLSTQSFKADKHIDDDAPPYDICQLAHVAGAALTTRVSDPKEVTGAIQEALRTPGFALVEISSLCQQYGATKVAELQAYVRPEVNLKRQIKIVKPTSEKKNSLFSIENSLAVSFSSGLEGRLGILLAGSAGGGVQSAAKLLAETAMISGLSSTMKGEYPITVGTGFSVAEVIVSREEINYTGLESPDLAIIVSEDGYRKVKDRLSPETTVFIDQSIACEGLELLQKANFSHMGGKKGAALAAVAYWLRSSGLLSIEALAEVASRKRHANKLLALIEKSHGVEA